MVAHNIPCRELLLLSLFIDYLAEWYSFNEKCSPGLPSNLSIMYLLWHLIYISTTLHMYRKPTVHLFLKGMALNGEPIESPTMTTPEKSTAIIMSFIAWIINSQKIRWTATDNAIVRENKACSRISTKAHLWVISRLSKSTVFTPQRAQHGQGSKILNSRIQHLIDGGLDSTFKKRSLSWRMAFMCTVHQRGVTKYARTKKPFGTQRKLPSTLGHIDWEPLRHPVAWYLIMLRLGFACGHQWTLEPRNQSRRAHVRKKASQRQASKGTGKFWRFTEWDAQEMFQFNRLDYEVHTERPRKPKDRGRQRHTMDEDIKNSIVDWPTRECMQPWPKSSPLCASNCNS